MIEDTQAEHIFKKLTPFCNLLTTHPLYKNIQTLDDVKLFMEYHVFAVWDFMCLLKELYRHLACTASPWLPTRDPLSTHLINSILVEEEGDLDVEGHYKSHFMMYLEGMEQLGANTVPIQTLIDNLIAGQPVALALENSLIPEPAKAFMKTTFSFFDQPTHAIASAFTFGREGVIELMFAPILAQLKSNCPDRNVDKVIYYFERHIELDSEDHFPKALTMLNNLCQQDKNKWKEVEEAALCAIMARRQFFDDINEAIVKQRTDEKIYHFKQEDTVYQAYAN